MRGFGMVVLIGALFASTFVPQPVVAAGTAAAVEVTDDGDRTYLKRHGTGWVRVRRGAETLEILGPGQPPVSARPPLGGASDLFEPWVAYPTGSWPEALAIGDINGDGLNDIALVTSYYFDPDNDYQLFVFPQKTAGSLRPPVKYPTLGTYTQRPQSVAIGDVNGDGRNDVVIGNSGMGVGVFTQNSSGGLDPVVLYPSADSKCVRIADLNHDGRLDVVGAGWGTNTVSVLLQQPSGALGSPVVYAAPHSGYDDLEVGDVNSDGRTDVLVMSGQLYATPNISVLYQRADGTLGDLASRFIGTNILSHGIGVGDVNADGLADVVASYGGNSPSSRMAIFPQQGDGTLGGAVSVPSYDIPQPVEIGDADGNSFDDVVVAHGGWVALGVYLQGSNGQLGTEELYPIPYASQYNTHGLALGDLNRDGATDVAIADYNSGLVVLRHKPWFVTVTVPNTPLVWPVGTAQTISWTSQLPTDSRVDIAVSRDGGVTWTPIASAVPDTGSHAWTVTGPPSTSARIRVSWRTARFGRPGRTDMSDVDFIISSTANGAALAGPAHRR